jgi:4-amino-4-deoxy-L-arabinose transferase-like glycosyltransferase
MATTPTDPTSTPHPGDPPEGGEIVAPDVVTAPNDEELPGRDPTAELPAIGPSWLPFVVAFALPAIFFFLLPPLTKSGLWDPHELNVADLARRIALNLHDAANLALEGADNSLPHLNDLGRPQLPFTSIALGFKFFGLHEWSGRTPLALWGVLGVVATFGFVSRLVDKRAGVFAAVALTTTPLYFVQARTMLGDVVMMAALAMSFGGLCVAVFDRRDDGTPDVAGRAAWLAVAAAGLAAGWFTRGGLIGVGLPLVSVGLAWLLARGNGGRRVDGLADAVGTLALAAGLVVSAIALGTLAGDKRPDLDPFVGAMMRPPGKYPTFDFMIGHLTAALAPWSAFAPFAFGRLFLPPVGRRGHAFEKESEARLALLVGVGVAMVAHGWMAARTDLVAFAAPALIAAGCGVALRDYERGAHPSVAVGVGTAVLLGISHHELHDLPEKAFHAFGVVSNAFPQDKGFRDHAVALWWVVLGGFAGLAFLTFVERDARREPFQPRAYLRALVSLRDAWDGMLALAYFAMIAGASLAGLVVWIGTRLHAKWLPQLSVTMKDVVLHAWWVTAFAPLVAVFGLLFWCDVWLWAFGRARPFGRSTFTRGFEPFEQLAREIRGGRLAEGFPKLFTGNLDVTPERLDEGVGLTAVLLIGPLMFLQVPVVVFAGLVKLAGLKALVAAALALPSGILVFLALGVVGDLLRGSRAAFLLVGAAVVAAVLCVSFYPALANQLSPKEVFESYRKVKRDDEPLALFGVGGRTAAYYAGGQPIILKEADGAIGWLLGAEGGSRRFVAVRGEELARLNRAYRERTGLQKNVPVLDARSSQVMLVASSLASGEKSQNPLGRYALEEPATVDKKLDVNFEDKLQVLGYEILDGNGKRVPAVTPGKKYHLRTFYKVLAPIASEWQMFIHIDGFQRRHNGDHAVCEGKYPMTMWRKDDLVVDDYEFSLEPNFSPGPYTFWFGFFLGEGRLKVTGGASDGENRVNGGTIRVQ